MPIIDDIDFHLTDEQLNSEEMIDGLLVPMGLYIVWCGKRNLLSEACLSEVSTGFLKEYDDGELSCRDVVDFEFDAKFFEYQFTPEGLKFTNDYYMTDQFFADLMREFSPVKSVYDIPDNKKSLERVSSVLDKRFEEIIGHPV